MHASRQRRHPRKRLMKRRYWETGQCYEWKRLCNTGRSRHYNYYKIWVTHRWRTVGRISELASRWSLLWSAAALQLGWFLQPSRC